MRSTPTEQCIVLPFRRQPGDPFDGTGLALHFLIGNVLVLHTGFKEMWFGWRAKKIFPQPETLQNYCRDAGESLNLTDVSREQKIRFWIYGSCTATSATLHVFDAQAADNPLSPVDLAIHTEDGLMAFRTRL